jgi:hypothetical protein
MALASGTISVPVTMGVLAGCVILYLVILKVTKCWNKPTYSFKKGA